MSTNDIMKLSLLPEQEKRESIIGLRDIVCGIRIFNKDAGHCGEGLIDSMCLWPAACRRIIFVFFNFSGRHDSKWMCGIQVAADQRQKGRQRMYQAAVGVAQLQGQWASGRRRQTQHHQIDNTLSTMSANANGFIRCVFGRASELRPFVDEFPKLLNSHPQHRQISHGHCHRKHFREFLFPN